MNEKSELTSLTGLRGFAAMLVMLRHYFDGVSESGPTLAFVMHGYLWVDLFFVLSGFVITLNYERLFTVTWHIKVFALFIWKRMRRIYPLYIVTTMVGIAVFGLHDRAAATFLSNLVMVQAWGVADSINGASWSISTEFGVYLLFPLIVVLVPAARIHQTYLAYGLAVMALIYVATQSDVDLHQSANAVGQRPGPLDVWAGGTLYPLIRCMAGFSLGVATFRFAQNPIVSSVLRTAYVTDGLAIGLGLLIAGQGTDVFVVMMFVPFVGSLILSDSYSRRVLESRPLLFLGLISYSIYLIHPLLDHALRVGFILTLTSWRVPHAFLIGTALTMVLVLLLATMSYYLVEKPGREWKLHTFRLSGSGSKR